MQYLEKVKCYFCCRGVVTDVVVGGGQHEGCVSVEILAVWVGSVGQQTGHAVSVAETGSPEQGIGHVLLRVFAVLSSQRPLHQKLIALGRRGHKDAKTNGKSQRIRATIQRQKM